MKHLLSMLAIALMASFQLTAQATTEQPEAPVSGAKMTLESDVVDYGTIDQGSEPSATLLKDHTKFIIA